MPALLRRPQQKRPAAVRLDDEHVGALGVRDAVGRRLGAVHQQVPLQADAGRGQPGGPGEDAAQEPGRGHPVAAPHAVRLDRLGRVHKVPEQVVQVADLGVGGLDLVRVLGEDGPVLLVQRLEPADVDELLLGLLGGERMCFKSTWFCQINFIDFLIAFQLGRHVDETVKET